MRLLLTCLFGFAGLLCIDELLDVKLKHINKIAREPLRNFNPKIKKTDQNREGRAVYISRIKSECCPVKYLETYLQKAKLDIPNDKVRS